MTLKDSVTNKMLEDSILKNKMELQSAIVSMVEGFQETDDLDDDSIREFLANEPTLKNEIGSFGSFIEIVKELVDTGDSEPKQDGIKEEIDPALVDVNFGQSEKVAESKDKDSYDLAEDYSDLDYDPEDEPKKEDEPKNETIMPDEVGDANEVSGEEDEDADEGSIQQG